MSVEERLVDPAEAAEFVCPICTDVSPDMVETLPCGHLFCTPCLSRHVSQRAHCPTCRTSLGVPAFQPTLYTRRKVENLRVRCAKRPRGESKDGCGDIFTLKEDDTHKRRCQWEEDTCICGASMARKDLYLHRQAQCPVRTLACRLSCGWYGPANVEPDHHVHCPWRPRTCQHCKAQVSQKELAYHEEACDMKPVACPVCSATCLQKQLENHVRSTAGHLSALCTEVSKMRTFLTERGMMDTYKHPPFSFFYNWHGRRRSCLVRACDTVEHVRAQLADDGGNNTTLSWNGKYFRDTCTLKDYALVSCNVAQPVEVIPHRLGAADLGSR